MSKVFGLVLVMSLAGAPVMAQNVQGEKNSGAPAGIVDVEGVSGASLRDLVDYSDGYVGIRDNVLLIEGEDSIQVCNFDLSEDYFVSVRENNAEAIAMNRPRVACVPLDSFAVSGTSSSVESPLDLVEFVDNSDGYENLRDNILMIEGVTEIGFCHFDVSDDLFVAAAAGDVEGMIANRGTVTCVPFEEVVQQ
jgi:hypothetical protein